jgi:hypothetical protein
MLFISGARDALAELELLTLVVADLGERGTLRVIECANHSFKVAAKSGRTSGEAETEALDALADWIDAISLAAAASGGCSKSGP